jgi:hypothetical protein
MTKFSMADSERLRFCYVNRRKLVLRIDFGSEFCSAGQIRNIPPPTCRIQLSCELAFARISRKIHLKPLAHELGNTDSFYPQVSISNLVFSGDILVHEI